LWSGFLSLHHRLSPRPPRKNARRELVNMPILPDREIGGMLPPELPAQRQRPLNSHNAIDRKQCDEALIERGHAPPPAIAMRPHSSQVNTVIEKNKKS
jgi:hypothetical protein